MKTKKESLESLDDLYSNFPKGLTTKKVEELINIYNNFLYPSEIDNRQRIIKELLGSIGDNFIIEQPFFCDHGYNIHIGKNFYANSGCTLHDTTSINIGDGVMLGPNVKLYTEGRHLNSKGENITHTYPISIGNDVWIGGNVVILPGVTIGDNAFIVTGSIVCSNIPSNAFAEGNPARVIKYIKTNNEV